MKNKLIYILFLIPYLLIAQHKKVISGTVIEAATNTPIPGASIYVSSKMIGNKTSVDGIIEGSMLGTTSDFDGNFSFKVPSSVTHILVSYMGFETKKVAVIKNNKNLVVKLTEKSETLDEIVITGYQKIEKRKMTSSYANVKVSEIQQAGMANVDQMLSGKISGVIVQTTNGAPGAPAKIQIRGTSTLNGASDPLWVLDGIPLEGNDVPKDFKDKDNIDNLQSYAIAGINPKDIENITILKDASATSIYGARAANGVIVITTKKGKKGTMRVNFGSSAFVTQKPNFSKLNLMNSNQKVDFELYLASRPDLNYQSDRGEIARILNHYKNYDSFQKNGFNSISPKAQSAINNLKNSQTNWGNELYQLAINQQYNLSISGGNDKSTYYFSLGYFDEQGATKGAGLNRYNITFKNNYSITDKLTAGIAVFGNRNKTFSYITGIDAYTNPSYYSRRANPYLKVVDANGNYVYDPDLIERSDLNLNYNILEERNNTNYQLISNSLKPIFDVEYKISDKLSVTSQFGMQFDFNQTEKLAKQDSYFKRKYRQRSRYSDGKGGYNYFLPKGGIIQNWNSNSFQYNWKTMANYNTYFNDIHEIDVMIGSELRKSKTTLIHTKGFGFNANTLTTIPITDKRALGSASFKTYDKIVSENAYASFFSTASYTFDKKYTVFGSLRYDGSNLFGVNPKYRYLPLWSIAGSWNVTRERFMENADFISELKLRGSYGVQGNIDKTTSPFVIGEFLEESILPNITEESIRVINAPNKNLRWEKTVSYNAGFDIGFIDHKVYLSADYYYRKSTDLIGLKATPLENGFNFINTNWATITNSGFELAINTKNITSKNFKWTTSLSISHNKNRVNNIEIREDDLKPSLKGYSANAIFAIKTAGVDSNGLPIFIKNGKKVSAVDFYNLSNGTDGSQLTRKQHRNLYSYVGDGTPKFSGGFINKFKYKQFDLSISTNFNLKQTVKRTPSYHLTQIEPGKNYSTEVLNAGKGNLPALIGSTSSGFDTNLVYRWFHSSDDGKTYNDLDIWVKDISYIRVNNIKLGYTFPKEYIKKLNLSSLNLNVEARNLFVFGTNYDGYFDPETYGSIYAQPVPKIVSLGFNLSF